MIVILDVDINEIRGHVAFIDHREDDEDYVSNFPYMGSRGESVVKTEAIHGHPVIIKGKGKIILGMSKKAKSKIGDLISAIGSLSDRNFELASSLSMSRMEIERNNYEKEVLKKKLRRCSHKRRFQITKFLNQRS